MSPWKGLKPENQHTEVMNNRVVWVKMNSVSGCSIILTEYAMHTYQLEDCSPRAQGLSAANLDPSDSGYQLKQ